MINRYGVIGSPISHSLSPVIHNTLYERYHFTDCEYSPIEVDSKTLNSFLHNIERNNIRGFNITMPLKTKILSHLTFIDFSVINGSNTVKVTEHGLFGYSTDAAGFYKSLTVHGHTYANKNIVFLGYGGVTRSLIEDAVNKGAKKITVLNRTISKIQNLIGFAYIDELNNWGAHLSDCDLLINTTPMGMKHCPPCLDYTKLTSLPSNAAVCDLIYEPDVTPLLKYAGEYGYFTLNGLDMLIWQAFYAFKIFFGIMPDAEDYKAVKDAVAVKRNQESPL